MSNINPDHYKMAGGRQAFEVIGDVCDTLESRGAAGAEIYYIGSALKYLLRYGAKGDADEQIRKAIRFLQMALPEEGEEDDDDLAVTCDSESTHRVTFSIGVAHLTGRQPPSDGPRALAREAEVLGIHFGDDYKPQPGDFVRDATGDLLWVASVGPYGVQRHCGVETYGYGSESHTTPSRLTRVGRWLPNSRETPAWTEVRSAAARLGLAGDFDE